MFKSPYTIFIKELQRLMQETLDQIEEASNRARSANANFREIYFIFLKNYQKDLKEIRADLDDYYQKYESFCKDQKMLEISLEKYEPIKIPNLDPSFAEVISLKENTAKNFRAYAEISTERALYLKLADQKDLEIKAMFESFEQPVADAEQSSSNLPREPSLPPVY